MCLRHAHKMIVPKTQCVESQTSMVNANLAKVNGMVCGVPRSAQRTVEKVQKGSALVAANAMSANQATMAGSATNSAQRTVQTVCSMTIWFAPQMVSLSCPQELAQSSVKLTIMG